MRCKPTWAPASIHLPRLGSVSAMWTSKACFSFIIRVMRLQVLTKFRLCWWRPCYLSRIAVYCPTNHPRVNPTVNWGRFLKASLFEAGEAISIDTPSMGGSTLATQIEKFRHSQNGVTSSVEEKLRQMVSASVRVYQQGMETIPARRQLVLDYLNTVPLAAAPGYGEVNGIGDGPLVWFGADPAEVDRLLSMEQVETPELREQGMALRQVLALMIAHRRPSYYLLQNRRALDELADAHLRLLRSKGRISPTLAEAAMEQSLEFRDFPLQHRQGLDSRRDELRAEESLIDQAKAYEITEALAEEDSGELDDTNTSIINAGGVTKIWRMKHRMLFPGASV